VKALQDSQVLDRTARLWRVADSAPLSVITDSGGPINKVRFSPDNRTLTREEWSARFRDRDYQPPCQPRAAATNSRIRPWSFTPRLDSMPLDTSTPHG
jgi:WD40 repeat protein